MEHLLEVIRYLTTPFDPHHNKDSKLKKKSISSRSLLLELCENVSTKVELTGVSKELIEHPEASPSWKFTCTILEIIRQLKKCIETIEEIQSEEEKSIEILSIQSQQCIKSCVELSIGFGILPYLLPGVGIPVKLRKSNRACEEFYVEERKITPLSQFNRLSHVLEMFIDISTHESFNYLITEKYFGDILAGLVQTCKSPIAKPHKIVASTGGDTKKEFTLTTIEYCHVMATRKKLEVLMKNLFAVVPKTMLVSSLLMIGAVEKPRWMLKSCNEMLYEILFTPSGLKTVSLAVMEILGSSNEGKVKKVICNLILGALNNNNPKSTDKTTVVGYTNICYQCVDMIIPGGTGTAKTDLVDNSSAGVQKDLVQIGLYCATTLTNLNQPSTDEVGQEADETFKILELVISKLTTEMEGDTYEFSESASYALGILGTLCETATAVPCLGESSIVSPTDHTHSDDMIWERLEKFVPYLERLKGEKENVSKFDLSMQTTARNLLECIRSKGSVSSTKGEKVVVSRYERALQDAESVIVPVKGHGLLELTRLLEDGDEEALKNESNLLYLFQNDLQHEDSYVYLMAINGMAALGQRFHKIVVPVLIEQYDLNSESAEQDSKNPTASSSRKTRSVFSSLMTGEERVEFRMKIGEVLVKVIQKLGSDVAPLYRVSLTNACFRLVRDEEPLIRASALSNLGELCHLLNFALGHILTEVWYCVESLLQSEKSPEVRRAALHLMVLLLRGIEKDLEVDFLISNRDIGVCLRDARRMLTKMNGTETDTAANTHIQLALHELGLIVAKFFMIKDSSRKEY